MEYEVDHIVDGQSLVRKQYRLYTAEPSGFEPYPVPDGPIRSENLDHRFVRLAMAQIQPYLVEVGTEFVPPILIDRQTVTRPQDEEEQKLDDDEFDELTLRGPIPGPYVEPSPSTTTTTVVTTLSSVEISLQKYAAKLDADALKVYRSIVGDSSDSSKIYGEERPVLPTSQSSGFTMVDHSWSQEKSEKFAKIMGKDNDLIARAKAQSIFIEERSQRMRSGLPAGPTWQEFTESQKPKAKKKKK